MTRRLPATPNAYKRAFDILRSGGLVALPTETVYGLAASAKDDKAVKKLYDVKERSSDKPLALCIDSLQTAQKYAALSGLQATISLRWPDTDWVNYLQGLPLALTSANMSGQADPQNGDEVYESLAGKIELIIDDKPNEASGGTSGQASTIVSVSGRQAKLLRRGALGLGDFARFDIDWV